MGKRLLLGIITLVSLSVLAAGVAPKPGVDWPSFRGIQAAGIAEVEQHRTRLVRRANGQSVLTIRLVQPG